MFRLIAAGVVGLAGGVAVGNAVVAFLTVLDIVPRLAQLTRTPGYVWLYELALVAGATSISFFQVFGVTFRLPPWVAAPVGLIVGIFVGMLAAALAEVLNVIPVVARRFRMASIIALILWCLVLGKITGSLVYWLVKGFF